MGWLLRRHTRDGFEQCIACRVLQTLKKELTAFSEPLPRRRLVQWARRTRYVVADDVLVMFRGTFNTTGAVPLLTLHTKRNWEV